MTDSLSLPPPPHTLQTGFVVVVYGVCLNEFNGPGRSEFAPTCHRILGPRPRTNERELASEKIKTSRIFLLYCPHPFVITPFSD